MWHITTHTKRHMISTTWVEALGAYETMTFEYKNSKVDWSGKDQFRTSSRAKARLHHCAAIVRVMKQEEENA